MFTHLVTFIMRLFKQTKLEIIIKHFKVITNTFKSFQTKDYTNEPELHGFRNWFNHSDQSLWSRKGSNDFPLTWIMKYPSLPITHDLLYYPAHVPSRCGRGRWVVGANPGVRSSPGPGHGVGGRDSQASLCRTQPQRQICEYHLCLPVCLSVCKYIFM